VTDFQPPDYNTLRDNAVSYYLQNGGTQANVDSYFQQNPTQDYGRIASDAAQWYTDPSRLDPNVDDIRFGSPGGTVPNIDARNQNVAGYFGIKAPPAGQGYTFAPPGPVTPTNLPSHSRPRTAPPPAAGKPDPCATPPACCCWAP